MLPRNGKPHGQKTSAPVISFTRAHLPTVRANTVRPYGFACAYEFTCGAPRSAHPTGYRVPRLFNPQNICYNETIRYFEVEIVLLHTLRVKRNAGQGTPVKIPDRGHPFGCPLLCPQNKNTADPQSAVFCFIPFRQGRKRRQAARYCPRYTQSRASTPCRCRSAPSA